MLFSNNRCEALQPAILATAWFFFASSGIVTSLGILTETIILSDFEYLVNAVTLFITYKKSKV